MGTTRYCSATATTSPWSRTRRPSTTSRSTTSSTCSSPGGESPRSESFIVQHNEEEVAFIGLLQCQTVAALYIAFVRRFRYFISCINAKVCIKDDPKCLAMAFALAKVYHCQMNIMNSL